MADAADRDDLAERIDELEATLEALRNELDADRRDAAGARLPGRAIERTLRLTERLAVPAAVAALEANVRVLTFVQERLRDLERREPRTRGTARPRPVPVGDRMVERLDAALVRLEDALAEADLPQNAEARRLLDRARELNEEVRDRIEPLPAGPTVVEIDVEEELEEIRDDVATEASSEADDDSDDADAG